MKEKPRGKKEVEGIIALASKRGGFLTVEGKDRDFYIPVENLGTALFGDKVKAIIFYDQQQGQKIAKVTKIIERNQTKFVGLVYADGNRFYVRPSGRKVNLKILLKDGKKVEENQKVIAEIVSWKNQQEKPVGEIIEVLGKGGEHQAEMKSILYQYNIESYPSHIKFNEAELRSLINEEEIKTRKDFRNILTFTIDPEDAKDFDDALSFKKTSSGYEIGVHIADVSHFVRPGTDIDKEAQKRATSVYLVDRTVPMLPEILSNDLCSLVPNQDRLTFAVIFEVDLQGKIKKHTIAKTVINSNKRFSYEDVQKILENKSGLHSEELSILNDIAKKIRSSRFKNGSISLDTDELKFKLDPDGRPMYAYKKEQKDAHKLIEEYMLLANKYVAEYVKKISGQEDVKPFIYRIHDLPDKEKVANLKDVLKTLGYPLRTKDGELDPYQINEIISNVKNPSEQRLIKTLVLRSMAKAIYSMKNIGHFGLAFEHYTHFTSPIRRYPDVMVHRILFKYLKNPKTKLNQEEEMMYDKMSAHSSLMERKAMEAERDSLKLKQVQLMSDKIGKIYAGVVTGISEWGLYVEASETLCEGMVNVKSIKDDYYEIDKTGICLVGRKKKNKYCLGDEIKIKVIGTNIEKRMIDYEIAI